MFDESSHEAADIGDVGEIDEVLAQVRAWCMDSSREPAQLVALEVLETASAIAALSERVERLHSELSLRID